MRYEPNFIGIERYLHPFLLPRAINLDEKDPFYVQRLRLLQSSQLRRNAAANINSLLVSY